MKQKKVKFIISILAALFCLGLSSKANAADMKVALRSFYSGLYLCADLNINKYGPLFANRDSVAGDWEKFLFVDLGNDHYAIYSYATGKYLTAEKNGTRRLVADSSTLNTAETFYVTWEEGGGSGVISIKSCTNGNYVRFDSLVPEQSQTGMGVWWYLEPLG